MMNIFPIIVNSYVGEKTGEIPVSFFWNKTRFWVTKITDRWYQGEAGTEKSEAVYFKICTKSGMYFIVKHDNHTNNWFLVAPEDKSGLMTFPYERLN